MCHSEAVGEVSQLYKSTPAAVLMWLHCFDRGGPRNLPPVRHTCMERRRFDGGRPTGKNVELVRRSCQRHGYEGAGARPMLKKTSQIGGCVGTINRCDGRDHAGMSGLAIATA